jgi:hypothetical protein
VDPTVKLTLPQGRGRRERVADRAGPVPFGAPIADEVREQFATLWTNDSAVREVRRALVSADTRLSAALTKALTEVEGAMQRIAQKYERETSE